MKRKIEKFLKQLTDLTNQTGIILDSTQILGLVDDSGWIAEIKYDHHSQEYKFISK